MVERGQRKGGLILGLLVTKEFKWDCAHLLDGHLGLCKNLHGHTYKMEVSVSRVNPSQDKGVPGDVINGGPSDGMVIDFKDLKDVVEELIVNPMDHALICDICSCDPFEQELLGLCHKHQKKVYQVAYRPTAENMVRDFFHRLNAYAHEKDLTWKVDRIKLWETPTSYAEYTGVRAGVLSGGSHV